MPDELTQAATEHSLDAMTAAADHHSVLLENDRVRVLDSIIKPGDSTPVHTHRWPAVLYVLGTSDFVRYDAEGSIIFDSRETDASAEIGQAIWSPPLTPHFVRNVGENEIRVISVEVKDRNCRHDILVYIGRAIMRRNDQERTYTVTQEEYDAEIASGLDDEEVLRPGTYKIRRNPWAEKSRKAGEVKIQVLRGEEVIEEYWIESGQDRKRP
ncbi:MAG TPA: cupin domain-containing protein [Pyrinomonadaceae bacterium]|nr:cupin domain-containing protein [Pyrinomonadaceae bacterium]